jgi:hypothetical protein
MPVLILIPAISAPRLKPPAPEKMSIPYFIYNYFLLDSCDSRYDLYSRTINSLMSTSNKSDIFRRLFKSGCETFVHHLETVDGVTPICSDNHLLVRLFSKSTIFILFTGSMIIEFYVAKIMIYFQFLLKLFIL